MPKGTNSAQSISDDRIVTKKTKHPRYFRALRFGSKNAYWLQYPIGCFKV